MHLSLKIATVALVLATTIQIHGASAARTYPPSSLKKPMLSRPTKSILKLPSRSSQQAGRITLPVDEERVSRMPLHEQDPVDVEDIAASYMLDGDTTIRRSLRHRRQATAGPVEIPKEVADAHDA